MVLDVVLSVTVIASAIGIGLLVHRLRLDRLPPWASGIVTLTCGVGLIGMILTDWPVENLADFWASHSVLASMLSTLLLVGLVFLVYERAEQAHQDELADGLSGAGLGGMVENVIDIETALALVSAPRPPDELQPSHWAHWDASGKPLRWLRHERDQILTSTDDPRRVPVYIQSTGTPGWGRELVSQSTRRLLAGMRDWAPLIGSSQEGTAALLVLSDIRSDLMALQSQLTTKGRSVAMSDRDREVIERSLDSLRSRLRVLAVCFEDWSGAPVRRSEILEVHSPLSSDMPEFRSIRRTLHERFSRASADLGMSSDSHR